MGRNKMEIKRRDAPSCRCVTPLLFSNQVYFRSSFSIQHIQSTGQRQKSACPCQPGWDLPPEEQTPDQVDQLGQVLAHRCGTAMQMDGRPEQIHGVQLHAMEDPDEADMPACGRASIRSSHSLIIKHLIFFRPATLPSEGRDDQKNYLFLCLAF